MKYFIVSSLILLTALFACNQSTTNEQALQTRVDSLTKQLDNTYKPGLGEFMSQIQVHHAKLWFAGQNKNWGLADFEINEILEALSGINKYCTDRPEVKSLVMINPAIDSIANSIKQKDVVQFKSSYSLLTNTCNNCHHATSHAFNVITIPLAPPFSNQDFKAH